MDLKDSPSGKTPGRGRWRRRIAYAALSLFMLLVLIVLLAPTLALNGFVEGKVASIAAERLGRPVAIEGIRVGWRTPVRIDRIELPAIEGEDGRPAFALKAVRGTFSLGRIFRGMPIQFGEFEVGSIEANLIRLPDGRWNVDAIREHLGPGEEKPEEEEPEAEPSVEAPSFPVDFSRIEIKQMDFRVVDTSEGLLTGYENGGFALTWAGGTEPIELRLDGEFRAGDRVMPWDVDGEVTEWIDGERKLRMDAIRLAVGGGAGDRATSGSVGTRRGAGEFRIAASLVEDDPGSIIGRLPLRPWVDWSRGLPQAADVPEIDGQIDMEAKFRHRDKFQKAEAEARVAAVAAARLVMEGEEKVLPEQRLDLTFAGDVDFEAQRVGRLDLDLDSPVATAKVNGAGIALDDFAKTETLKADLLADLGAAATLGAQFLHGTDGRLLDAVFSARANLVPGVEEGSRLAFEADFSPGELITLAPLAENPPWLEDGPLDLEPLGFTWKGEVDAGPNNENFAVRVEGTRGKILKLGATQANYSKNEDSGQAWDAETGLELDVTMAFDRFIRRIAEGALDDLEGALRLQASASQDGPQPIASRGRIELAGLRLQLPENEAAFEEAATRVAWDLSFDTTETLLSLAGLEVKNSFLDLKAAGEASPKLVNNLVASGRLDLNALSDRLVALLKLETPPAGILEFEAGANGEIGKALDATLRVETPEPLEYAQPELVALSFPVGIEATARVTWADEKPEAVAWELARMEVGEILSASGRGRMGLGERPRVDAQLAADALFTPVTDMIDPVFWEQQNLAAVVEGGTRLEINAKGLLPTTDAEGRSTADLEVAGLLTTTIDYVEALQGETSFAAEGFTDEREFTVTVKGTEPEQIFYRDRSTTGLAMAQTSIGTAIGGFSMRSEVHAPGKGTVRLKLEDLTIEETQYADETMEAQLPPLHVSGAFAVDPSTTEAQVKGLKIELEGLASMAADAVYGGEAKTWSAKAKAKLGPLDGLMERVAFKGDEAPAFADLTGEAELDLDFHGTVPGEDFDPLEGVPAEGRMVARWSGIGLKQGEDLMVSGAGGEAKVEVSPGGNDFRGGLKLLVERVEIASLQPKTLEPIDMAATFRMQEMDRAEFALTEMSVASLGFMAAANGKVAGLRRALESEEELAPADYLRMLNLSGDFELGQSLGDLPELKEGFETGGQAKVRASFRSDADRVLSFVSSMEFDGVGAHLPETFDLEGLSGSWTAGKTLPMRRGLATPKSPAPGQLRAETIHLIADPFDIESHGNVFLFEGFQSGFTMRSETQNLIGGPATMQAGLGMRGEDPTLSGRLQVTGLDLGRLAPQLRDLKGPEAEINAVADFEWRIPESQEGGILNGITVQAASSRIGKRAFQRMLEALDPEQEDPRIQKAISALSLGRPSSVDLELRDSLLTFGAELETLGGFKVPLPIIERQSLGDVEQVYELDQLTPMVGMARTALLLLLSEDFETFEGHLNSLAESAP